MSQELQEMLKTIEELGLKLNKISKGKNITDPEVVSAIQVLESTINEYHKLMKDKANHS
jgi:hypothetical protein